MRPVLLPPLRPLVCFRPGFARSLISAAVKALSGPNTNAARLPYSAQTFAAIMPPKRKVSSDAESAPAEASSSKRTKVDDIPATGNGQPTNKTLPVNITFPPRTAGTLRICAWNVTSLASSQKKGFKQYVEAEDPDLLVLTETKVNNEPVDPELTARYPWRYWSISDKKSYAGTAILSKKEPLSITKSLPGHPDASAGKGRIVTLEFEKCYVVGTYVTNAGEKLKTLDAKKEWNTAFEAYVRELDSKKPVIWTGDLNVAPTELDLANPKRNWNKTPGYTEAETSWFAQFLSPPTHALDVDPSTDGSSAVIVPKLPFVDVWRAKHPDTRHYTYFSYRFNARAKNLGWRLDMFVVSERLSRFVKLCEIRDEIWGASDHCPVVMEIEEGAVL